MNAHPDRRIRRTRRALADALTELTSQHPYASIRVRDITDQADVGYATFYRHYESKDDLMLAVFAQVTGELEAAAADLGEEYFEQEGRLIFEHVHKYAGLYRSILQSREFVEKLKKLLAGWVAEHLKQHAGELETLAFPVELAANHMVVGLIGLIAWWLEKEETLPVREMARIYERLIVQATWHALPAANNLALPWCA